MIYPSVHEIPVTNRAAWLEALNRDLKAEDQRRLCDEIAHYRKHAFEVVYDSRTEQTEVRS